MDGADNDEDIAIIGPDDVKNYNPDNILPETPEVIDRIRKWLEPTPYDHDGGEYRRHLTSHVDGTGQWLIATDTYQKWHDGEDNGLLWIRGIPGSGKSVFAAMLTNELRKEGHPVPFFFFRQIIKANHEPVQMLRDWLDQILEYSPPLQRELRVYIDKSQTHLNRELSSLSIDDLWKHLKSALAPLRRVYLVADALDEMSKGNEEFLKALATLGSWKPNQVKVLITSRPVNTVEVPLCQLPALRIRLEESLVNSDIAKFVDHCLGQSTIPPEERALIKDAVPGRANGLFLYAKLTMDAFLEPNADVGQILTNLPTDLNAMYDDLLKEHAKHLHLLLCWATHAIRPLRLLEMAEMLSVRYDTPGDRHDIKSAKALVRVVCGPLLEIRPDETVSIVHHSLTEFLVGSTRSKSAGEEQRLFSFPVLLPGPTHEQLALFCIRYLELSGCLDSVPGAERTEADAPAAESNTSRHSAMRLQFPFADYACKNWAIHAAMSMSDTVPSGALLAAIDGFLASGRKLDAWLGIEWLPRATKGVTSSHVAARFGLTHYLESRVQCTRLPDVNRRDCKDQTMLFHAAEGGHAGVVKLLIDVGADPDAENYVGLKPLHRAATNGHAAVVAVLLHAGVDPLTKKTRDGPYPGYGKMPSTIGQTPLMYACQAGHVAAVEAFLPYLKCIETVQWALHWASNAGQAKVVQRLLQHPGVDANAKLRGCTPLFRACAGNDVATIEVLLEAGADATVLCQEHPNEQPSRDTHKPGPDCSLSPLEAFCNFHPEDTRPELDISQLQRGLGLLLQAGADIHRRDFLLRTPLHHASQRPPLFYLLLRAGADANAVTRDGTTPFHTLNMKGKWGLECINLLAEQGKVDINKRNPNDAGRTLLMRLIRCIPFLDPSICLAFINSLHPDCTIADEYGNAALHLAARIKPLSIRLRILEALLAAGARVDQRNHRGEMPIHLAHEISTIELLVSRGADLEAQDSSGATPLMRCVRDENLSFHALMADFLRIGARLDTRDFEGRTVIHNAIGNLSFQGPRAKDEVEVLQHILNFGIDPRQVDYAGNTVLHQLLQRKSFISRGTDLRGLVFEGLVALGVDPKAANHCGQTVLHVLSTKPYDAPMIDIVISACKEIINLPDNEGSRPIHLAVTVSEGTVAKLINAGADVSVSTDKQETPLHLAAAAEESNVVGMLLTAIQTTLQERAAALRLINVADAQGRTPLYHACLSGIPESVALLLGAGAETKREFCGPFENCLSRRLLEACTLFEREGRRKVEEVTGVSQPWMFFDPQYKFLPIPRSFYTRLDEILPMLADHGLDCCCVKKSLRVSLDSAIDKLSGSDFDHTLKCFRRLKAITVGGNERTTLSEFEPGLAFTRRWAEIRCDAATRPFHEMNLNFLVEGDRELSEKLFLKLLGSREFDLFEIACKTAERHLLLPNEKGWTVLHVLVALGHASLLERIATPAQVRLIGDPEWRKAQERTLGDGVKQPDFSICPLVLTACRRDSPNMEVLRLLVEKLSASVNASCLGHDWLEPTRYVLDDSPLHQVARGERWWQAYKALPYLLSQKPNLNVRNRVGETPLHIAIQKPPYFSNPFRKHVAKLLIEAGADVNAVTNSGVSCLEAAGDDTELVRLLIDHGAQVSVREVFAAIETKNVQGLQAMLFLDRQTQQRRRSFLEKELRMHKGHAELHALHRAATIVPRWMHDGEERAQSQQDSAAMVNHLLASGANPFSKCKFVTRTATTSVVNTMTNPAFQGFNFSSPKETDHTSSEKEFEENPIIHQILLENGTVRPFLELPGLNLEYRDSSGRTLLLAACSNASTFCSTVNFHTGQREGEVDSLLIDVLLQRGANTSARDNHGRNAIHTVFYDVLSSRVPDPMDLNSQDQDELFVRPLQSLLVSNPSLLEQTDDQGKTPLHYALSVLSLGFKKDNLGARIIDLLLSAGADPTKIDESTGDTALHILVRSLNLNQSCPGLFRRLLGLGLNINTRNADGETPLFGIIQGIKFIQQGSAAKRLGLKPSGYLPTPKDNAWQLLEDAGAGFKAKNNEGRNMLHLAAQKADWVEAFKRLVDLGVDPKEPDKKQRTSLDVAAACKNKAVLGLFERE